MTLFAYPTKEENSVKWYSKDDEKNFRRTVIRDAADQSASYYTLRQHAPNNNLPDEELIKFVGIVHLLSHDVKQRHRDIKTERRAHAFRVLEEQRRQRECGAVSGVKLALLSKSSSREAKDRARMTAFSFMEASC
jgi:hypothetical protein